MKQIKQGAMWGTLAASAVIPLTVTGPSHAQAPINVTVDGDLVAFGAQRPVEQFGSVLVPLRGVFEKLGATVAYDGGSKSILAVRGPTTVTLKLGSRDAQVNNMPRTLSVPAQAVNGTTLVPLRFVSEALGAQVKWQAASRTVIVTTTPGGGSAGDTTVAGGTPVVPANPAAPTGNVEVTSLTQNSGGRALKGGDTLTVSLRGTPGGTAAFSLPGIETAKSVLMRETAPGQYEGAFTIPNNITIKGASLLASLKVGNATSPLIQAGEPITVDSVGPKFDSLSPAPNAAIPPGKPLIYGTFSDAGTGINTGSVRLLVDNQDVTGQATITESFFSYRPAADLPVGKKEVVIVARDTAGNETRKTWAFTVAAGENPVKSLTVQPSGKTLEPGDVLTLQMTAAPGGRARYSLGEVVKNRPMRETAPGQYVGEYTLKKGDALAGVPISAVYTAADGRETTQTVEQTIQVAAGLPDKPIITNPQANGSAGGGSITITGKAAPGATVRYAVRYDGQLLIVPAGGAISNGEVKADANGVWTTPSISLSTPFGISSVSYTLMAVTVGATPTQTSDAVEVRFKR